MSKAENYKSLTKTLANDSRDDPQFVCRPGANGEDPADVTWKMETDSQVQGCSLTRVEHHLLLLVQVDSGRTGGCSRRRTTLWVSQRKFN